MLYAIKEHKGDAFRISFYGDKSEKNKHFVGYIADVDMGTLSFVTVNKLSMASCFTLNEAALLVIKLNKLNLLKYYEIIEDKSHGL
jgi:hypothetical protein